jgi:hypothetical protein
MIGLGNVKLFLLPSSRARSAWRGGVGGCFGILIGRRTRGETPHPQPLPTASRREGRKDKGGLAKRNPPRCSTKENATGHDEPAECEAFSSPLLPRAPRVAGRGRGGGVLPQTHWQKNPRSPPTPNPSPPLRGGRGEKRQASGYDDHIAALTRCRRPRRPSPA